MTLSETQHLVRVLVVCPIGHAEIFTQDCTEDATPSETQVCTITDVQSFRDLEEEWQAAKLGQSPKACQNPVISLAIRHSRTALKLICATPQAFHRLYTDS